ncbi:hypothetical protein EV193_111173 [Herbihabitans rhizosphaerae]|uniref:Uncharacterized protein n=1 Tax=Herbihabitans rhizosphaerae TaxID=1872711 RepID=A0A4Q7KIQ4_9PSEU|nr:hypothetical protein [Herbihabitans rhizosphaerae]RZS32788.1 hypothetical protein EV193_111173 [Herbihabitans rhizosphaerae]
MGAFGQLFGNGKLRKESADEDGGGQWGDPGPLDLDSGVVRVPRKESQPPAEDEQAEDAE